MFFSWIAYGLLHLDMTTFPKVFNDKFDKSNPRHSRFVGCDNWILANSYHTIKPIVSHVFFFVNEAAKIVNLVFPGTEADFHMGAANNWAEDFDMKFTKCPWKCGKVSEGILKVHRESIETQMDEYVKSRYEIVITGHSQGATIVTIVYLHLADRYSKKFVVRGKPRAIISVITLESQKIGDNEFMKKFNS